MQDQVYRAEIEPISILFRGPCIQFLYDRTMWSQLNMEEIGSLVKTSV